MSKLTSVGEDETVLPDCDSTSIIGTNGFSTISWLCSSLKDTLDQTMVSIILICLSLLLSWWFTLNHDGQRSFGFDDHSLWQGLDLNLNLGDLVNRSYQANKSWHTTTDRYIWRTTPSAIETYRPTEGTTRLTRHGSGSADIWYALR